MGGGGGVNCGLMPRWILAPWVGPWVGLGPLVNFEVNFGWISGGFWVDFFPPYFIDGP